MSTRRQERIARVIKEAVSDAIANHLSDPRIEGLITVTRATVAGDLQVADVYISIFGSDQAAQNKTFAAITHARSRIQSLLAPRLKSKFCPVLRFHIDEGFKKGLETMKLIDQISAELKEKESVDHNKEQL